MCPMRMGFHFSPPFVSAKVDDNCPPLSAYNSSDICLGKLVGKKPQRFLRADQISRLMTKAK